METKKEGAANQKVKILLAGGNAGRLAILQEFGQKIDGVEICAAVTNEQNVIQVLKSRSDIRGLFVDEYLRGGSVLSMLKAIKQLPVDHRPRIITSIFVRDADMIDKLKQMGVVEVMIMPYHLQKMYQDILFYVCEADEYSNRWISEKVNEWLSRLHIPPSCTGYWHMYNALHILVRKDCECVLTKELYPAIGKADCVSVKAVESGIRRAILTAYNVGTPEYKTLCKNIPNSTGKPLTNADFLNGVAQLIRMELNQNK